MKQDEIIRMAREAGLQHIPVDLDYPIIGKAIERFAALVAAHEREACAKVCDDIQEVWLGEPVPKRPGYECAAAIRARGEK